MIEQFVQASCRVGQSGGSGLQTWSKSVGITPDEEDELARVTDYRWSQGALRNTKSFAALPATFGFRQLRSGRLALFQSHPVPADHVGRPGSFVAHAFVFEEPIYARLGTAVRFWRSPSFRSSLTPDEVRATTRPPLLSPLPVEDL